MWESKQCIDSPLIFLVLAFFVSKFFPVCMLPQFNFLFPTFVNSSRSNRSKCEKQDINIKILMETDRRECFRYRIDLL